MSQTLTLGTRMSRTSPRPLITALVFRACFNGAFALWLVVGAPAWGDIFHIGALYALADGAMGLVTVLVLARHVPTHAPPLFRSLTFADAALRLGAGSALLALPGIPDLPLGVVLFFGVVGAAAGLFGVVATIGWFVARVRDRRAGQPWHLTTHELFDPLGAVGVVALVGVGAALIAGPPPTASGLRAVASSMCGALALAFIVSAIGVAGRGEPVV